ncbi:hAT-like transposase, RNase-H fold [Dillenia turbinata]|uniref:HAT-like transposase, RNase-H fold n=1 Tax=Dillenia turbinata TaxID=194707 RepID=A0AAN8YY10_9MAGN
MRRTVWWKWKVNQSRNREPIPFYIVVHHLSHVTGRERLKIRIFTTGGDSKPIIRAKACAQPIFCSFRLLNLNKTLIPFALRLLKNSLDDNDDTHHHLHLNNRTSRRCGFLKLLFGFCKEPWNLLSFLDATLIWKMDNSEMSDANNENIIVTVTDLDPSEKQLRAESKPNPCEKCQKPKREVERRSEVWAYFTKNEKNPLECKCNYCLKTLLNFAKGTSDQGFSLIWKFDQEKNRRDLTKLIITHELPFSFVKDPSFQKYVLDPPLHENWENVKIVHKFLKTFNIATNTLSGSKYCTANIFLCEVYRILMLLKQTIQDVNSIFMDMTNDMLFKFEKYWFGKEPNVLLSIAFVLDPRFKFKNLKFYYKRIYDSVLVDIMLDRINRELHALFEEYSETYETSMREQEKEVTLAMASLFVAFGVLFKIVGYEFYDFLLLSNINKTQGRSYQSHSSNEKGLSGNYSNEKGLSRN